MGSPMRCSIIPIAARRGYTGRDCFNFFDPTGSDRPGEPGSWCERRRGGAPARCPPQSASRMAVLAQNSELPRSLEILAPLPYRRRLPKNVYGVGIGGEWPSPGCGLRTGRPAARAPICNSRQPVSYRRLGGLAARADGLSARLSSMEQASDRLAGGG